MGNVPGLGDTFSVYFGSECWRGILRPEHPNSPVVAQVFKVISIFIEPFFFNPQNSLLGSLGKYYHTFLAYKEYKYLVVWGWLSDFTLLCLEVFHKCNKMQS